MIFLLFVVSVALMEALLHHDEKKQLERKAMDQAPRHPAPSRPDPAGPVTHDLISLRHAIHNHASKELPDERTSLPATTAATEDNRYNRNGGGTE